MANFYEQAKEKYKQEKEGRLTTSRAPSLPSNRPGAKTPTTQSPATSMIKPKQQEYDPFGDIPDGFLKDDIKFMSQNQPRFQNQMAGFQTKIQAAAKSLQGLGLPEDDLRSLVADMLNESVNEAQFEAAEEAKMAQFNLGRAM